MPIPPSSLHRASRRIGRFTEAAWWVARHGLLAQPRRLFVVLGAQFLGLMLQIAAFGLLLAFAHSLERAHDLEWRNWSLGPPQSAVNVARVALASATLLALAGGLVYASRTQSVHMRRLFEERTSRRCLHLASHLPHPCSPMANRTLADGRLASMAFVRTRRSGRVLSMLINGVQPAARMLVALAVLLAASPVWTASMLAIIPFAALLLYQVNLSVARNSRHQEEHAKPASKARRQIVQHILEQPIPLDPCEPTLADFFGPGSRGGAKTDAFFKRFLILERGTLITNLFAAVVVMAVLLAAGARLIHGHGSWTLLGAYVVALRFFLLSTQQVVKLVLQTSRHYPYVRDLADFLNDGERALHSPPSAGAGGPMSLALLSLTSGAPLPELNPGGHAWVLTGSPADRTLAARIQGLCAPGTSQAIVPARTSIAPPASIAAGALLRRWQPGSSSPPTDPAHPVLLATAEIPAAASADEPVLLVGSGLVGWCTVKELSAHPEWRMLALSSATPGALEGLDEDDEDDEEG